MRAALVRYSSDVAPTGMIIERPSHGELKHALTDTDAARDIQKIGFEAWRRSDWLRNLARANNMAPDALASRAFDPNKPDKVTEQYDRVKASADMGKRVVYWFGEALKPFPKNWDGSILSLPDNSFSYFPQGWPHGFAKIEQKGLRGGRVLQTAQRLANIGARVCLHDLDVLPDHQGKGLGTAIAYVGLGDQPQRLPSTLDTPLANTPMIAWAEKYGYHLRDEYTDTELFAGVAVNVGHFVADSVGAVRESMELLHPWLAKGDRESMLARVLDEGEAEMISQNPRG